MPNYYANRGNDNKRGNSSNENIRNTDYSYMEQKNERVEKSSKDLIIDGNSVYEIDPDCFEKVKQRRQNSRQDWNRR
ncbi:hypothetical protein SAMN02745136_01181 [Anaerocolumna jejuensis DSM 15929]|uniref:Uncharacterized protein n=1 Tax=Anaerocolumna jejuensis DSM 15929 TaxID=1121322 RepID=A0A1M6MUX7_9FIRM|nr:hypothetical protein [Anaerocolumna jejuensis]SHJ87093.1 hypothetical protein SAMN02745136_01181 [Anaerocolumna jejuensis DSM 15929]